MPPSLQNTSFRTDSKDMIINAMAHSLSFDDNNGFESSSSGGGGAGVMMGVSTSSAAAAGGGAAGGGGSEGGEEEGEGGEEPRPSSPEPDDKTRLGGGEDTSPGVDLFEKMCSDNFNRQQQQDLDNMWNEKERQITFSSSVATLHEKE